MDPLVRAAVLQDVPVLVELMTEFYQEAGLTLSSDAATKAFTTLLEEPSRCRVWLVERDSEPVGYIVLTLSYSMEFGGLRGFVDDFFVRPAARRKGYGTVALKAVKAACRELNVRALLVETGPQTHPARGVYARAGFKESGRMLLSQTLSPPIHEQ